MKHRLLILSLLLLSCSVLKAVETDSVQIKPKQSAYFNWGAKVGFSSVLPVVNTFTIEDIPIESNVEYKVGYMAALFLRLNFDRFFLQPSLAWHTTESRFNFNIPEGVNPLRSTPTKQMSDQLNLKIHSLALPVLIGYNLVKEKPFGLSIMAGASMKYNYRIQYTSNLDYYNDKYTTDDTRFRVNLMGGIGVTLWQLFFDFTYEVGLNHREKNFKRIGDNLPLAGNIVLDKRLNMMGFSLGFLF